ncbi:MAG: protein kinase [Candidatus Omnitrophica bacterium]|nr:protein kinase [Candidatus Omnitrophota bacterium]
MAIFLKRLLTVCVLVTFSGMQILSMNVWANQELPAGVGDVKLLSLSHPRSPILLKGIRIFPQEPFHYSFIVDSGATELSDPDFQRESSKMIKYFLASLTIPPEDLWVNLSPYEKDRVMPQAFSQTEMGRDLLVQDYVLKQLTASLMYPGQELGERFWEEVYARVYQEYGRTDISLDTFNKVWIVPDKAVVFEQDDSAFILESRLKVLTEEDYVAMMRNHHQDLDGRSSKIQAQSGDMRVPNTIINKIIIPAIEQEVNSGEHFVPLRQMYQAMILAEWFRRHLEKSLLGSVYVGKKKIRGIDITDRTVKERIYQRYLEIFQEGVFNYVKEDYDPATQQVIPRKYFSGGVNIPMQLRSIYQGVSDHAMLTDRLGKRAGELKQIYVNLIQDRFSSKTPEQRRVLEMIQSDPELIALANGIIMGEGPEIREENVLLFSDYSNTFQHSKDPVRWIKSLRTEKQNLSPDELNRLNMQEAARLIQMKELGLRGFIPNIMAWGIKKDGRFWMDMGGVEKGLSLQTLRRVTSYDFFKDEMSNAAQLNMFIRVAESLEAMHAAGWVHNDVHLSRFIVNYSNLSQVMPADFTHAAKVGTEIDRTKQRPLLSAPESYADPKSDVYGLGLALWEFFIGQSPQPGDPRPNMLDVYQSLDMTRIPSGISGSPLLDLVRNMIAADVGDRPTMEQAIEQLEDIQGKFIAAEMERLEFIPQRDPMPEGQVIVDQAMLSKDKMQSLVEWLKQRGQSISDFIQSSDSIAEWEAANEAFLEQFRSSDLWPAVDGNELRREVFARLRFYEGFDSKYVDLTQVNAHDFEPIEGAIGADGIILKSSDFDQSGVFYKTAPFPADSYNMDLMLEAESYSILSDLSDDGVIPKLLAVGVMPDGRFWLKLQGLSGGATSINKSIAFKQLPLREKIKHFITSARQLDTMHKRDRVHRDVAPRNILWDGHRLMWIDLSRMVSVNTRVKQKMLDVMHRYTPSEVKTVEKTDVYSFGKTLADFTRYHDKAVRKEIGLSNLISQMSGKLSYHSVNRRPEMSEVIERLEAMVQQLVDHRLNDQAVGQAFDQAMLIIQTEDVIQNIRTRVAQHLNAADLISLEEILSEPAFRRLVEDGRMLNQPFNESLDLAEQEEPFAKVYLTDTVGERVLRAKQPSDNFTLLKEVVRLSQLSELVLQGNSPTVSSFGFDQAGRMTVTVTVLPEGQKVLSTAWQQMGLDARIAVLRQVALNLDRLHRDGLVQRDLTPDSFTFRPDNALIQFSGLAKIAQQGERFDVSSVYQAPEQTATAQSDVYSLGMVIWQSLFGAFAVEGVGVSLESFLSLDRTQIDSRLMNSGLFDLVAQMISPNVFERPGMPDVSSRLKTAMVFIGRAEKDLNTGYDEADKAMLGAMMQGQNDRVGGIDLNSRLLDMETRHKTGTVIPEFQFDPADFQDVEGFTPVILQIVPITNLPLILGVYLGEDEMPPSPIAYR